MDNLAESTLGRTGIGVTRLGYGSMELRHVGTPSRPQLDTAAAGALLNAALDGGITYIDTSPTYGPAEELIGAFLSGRRSEFSLATKTGFVIDELPERRHLFTRDVVRKGLEWSLRRLNTDYVDVVQLPGNPTPAELIDLGTFDELEKLRTEGKCRFLGVSGWEPNLSQQVDWGKFDVFQIPYSALERDNESLIARAAEAGIGTVVRGGVAQGTVSEAQIDGPLVSGDRPADKRAKWDSANLGELADGAPGDFMIRYLLSNPHIDTAIIGTSDIAHLQQNLAAASLGPLPRSVYELAEERLDAIASAGAHRGNGAAEDPGANSNSLLQPSGC